MQWFFRGWAEAGKSCSPRLMSRRGKKVITVYLPESVWRDAKMLAVRTDTTIDAIMRRGCQEPS